MKNPMYKRYANIQPIGAIAFCNTFGMVVFEPDENDKFDCDYVCAWSNGENYHGFHKHMVHYSTAGRPFIRKGNLRIYMDEIMKV